MNIHLEIRQNLAIFGNIWQYSARFDKIEE